MKTFFSCYFIMATRKYKKQRKGNLKKKSLGKKKRSMKKRGKSLKKRGGNGDDDIYDIYAKLTGTTETSIKDLSVDEFLTLHEKFINSDHGSCSQSMFSQLRKEDCDKTKVLFYKGVLEQVLNYTKMISDMVFDEKQARPDSASRIKGDFVKILIKYAKKLEKHAIYLDAEELEQVGIRQNGKKFVMNDPLHKFTFNYHNSNPDEKSTKESSQNTPESNNKFMLKEDKNFLILLLEINHKINKQANLQNVIGIDYDENFSRENPMLSHPSSTGE